MSKSLRSENDPLRKETVMMRQVVPSYIISCVVFTIIVALFAAPTELVGTAHAQLIPSLEDIDPLEGIRDIQLPTLGGPKFWTDQHLYFGYRIQQNSVTNHCRLLDSENVRLRFGSYEQCVAKLNEIRNAQRLPSMRGRVVIGVHGWAGTRIVMTPLLTYIEKNEHVRCCRFEYASTQGVIEDHTNALIRCIQGMPDVEQIDFVAHSMGNIILRRVMAKLMETDPQGRLDPRIHSFVMIAPPNQGAIASETWFDAESVIRAIGGPAIQQLGIGWSELEPHLATPPCSFGIIAGGLGNETGLNPLLPGDNDSVVTVATTQLTGASDFRVVPATHTVLTLNPKVMAYTTQFFRNGYFESEESRVAIE
jgi:hypothetical protein